ncbi:unnamed protein product [Schistocephalus solidus]|uniref:Reverse transcriptase domain-containing protein n=1 Tax=Schistocephalus solidus TaxID=70667 RepID=A0A3P7CGN4_SCHSO|nr:unnamed protein product [Schistocephalus solidus]
MLTEKSQILKRWAKHFRSVLNCSSAIDPAIDQLPQVDAKNNLDLPPSLPETIRALQKISSGNPPGSDAISPEVYKHGGPRLIAELTTLFQEMWHQRQVPQDFKDLTIVHFDERKGNRQLCDNHRDVLLLNIMKKLFTRILINRLNGHLVQGLLPESQCGFGQHHGTTKKILATISYKRSARRFEPISILPSWIRRKACTRLMFSAMLMDAYRDEQPGIRIAYRTDGHLLNSRRM